MDIQRKVNHLSKEHRRIKDLLAIIVVSYEIHQTDVGAMEKKSSMENSTIAISMVTGKMNAKKNLSLKVNVTIARSMGTNLQNAKPR